MNIQLTYNWLLISIDRDVDRALVNGIEIDTTWEKEAHAIVSGTIYAVSKLKYVSPQYRSTSAFVDGEAPLEFDADMEVQVGDYAYFNYLSMNKAIKSGRVVEIEGKMYAFIRYDRLYAVERNGEFIGVNGYILAIREDYVQTSFLDLPDQRNKNEAVAVAVGAPLREYFWEKLQSAVPYKDHGFIQPGDKIIFRETSGRQLENKVVRARDIDYIRLQEVDVFARIRDGVLTPNTGIVLIEELQYDMSELLEGADGFNKTGKGRVIASLEYSGIVYYKKANIRIMTIEGEEYTFVGDCREMVVINGLQVLS